MPPDPDPVAEPSLPLRHEMFELAEMLAVGVVFMVRTILSLAASHGPPASGSSVVSLSVTVPAVISPAEGV